MKAGELTHKADERGLLLTVAGAALLTCLVRRRWMASSRTAAYEPAKPIPAMITAPVTTTPIRTRCARVSWGTSPFPAARVPLPHFESHK